jgi:hypothetical protein
MVAGATVGRKQYKRVQAYRGRLGAFHSPLEATRFTLRQQHVCAALSGGDSENRFLLFSSSA